MVNCPVCSFDKPIELKIDPRTITREYKLGSCPKCRKTFEVREW